MVDYVCYSAALLWFHPSGLWWAHNETLSVQPSLIHQMNNSEMLCRTHTKWLKQNCCRWRLWHEWKERLWKCFTGEQKYEYNSHFHCSLQASLNVVNFLVVRWLGVVRFVRLQTCAGRWWVKPHTVQWRLKTSTIMWYSAEYIIQLD